MASWKNKQRENLLSQVAKECNCPVTYVNAVGGNDELIFDGTSMTLDREGKILTEVSLFGNN